MDPNESTDTGDTERLIDEMKAFQADRLDELLTRWPGEVRIGNDASGRKTVHFLNEDGDVVADGAHQGALNALCLVAHERIPRGAARQS